MKDFGLKEFFSFSKGERNGIIILLILLVILIFVPFVYKRFYSPSQSLSQEFYNKVDSFFSSVSNKPNNDFDKNKEVNIINEEVADHSNQRYFYFDPNTSSLDELTELGFTAKQAQVIIKYREKSGGFHKPEDFSKVFVVDSLKYIKLEPWIRIDTSAFCSLRNAKTQNTTEDSKVYIEINSADSLDLLRVKGIGKVYARRIISYRESLGGFININQFSEIWGFKPEMVKTVSSQIWVDSLKVKTININIVSFEDLKKHPYLTEFQAKGIIYYRNKVGSIKKVDELLTQKILPSDKFKKVKSYFSVN